MKWPPELRPGWLRTANPGQGGNAAMGIPGTSDFDAVVKGLNHQVQRRGRLLGFNQT